MAWKAFSTFFPVLRLHSTNPLNFLFNQLKPTTIEEIEQNKDELWSV
jgi:hypothetical protein